MTRQSIQGYQNYTRFHMDMERGAIIQEMKHHKITLNSKKGALQIFLIANVDQIHNLTMGCDSEKDGKSERLYH